MGLWGDYMTGDLMVKGATTLPHVSIPFPYVRQRRNIAMIGVSTAISSRPGQAIGTLGPAQIEALASTLANLRNRGFYRILMIHHPPLPGLAKRRKALTDAADLAGVLQDEGCDLVVHGHNHETMRNRLASRHGPVNILGAPSATSSGARGTEPAAWNEFHIQRSAGRWQCAVRSRHWDPDQKGFMPQTSYSLEQ
jgi:hypothetical protein